MYSLPGFCTWQSFVRHRLGGSFRKGNMAEKTTLLKGAIYSILFFLFIIFYVKDLMIDFAKGRSTMTSRYQKVETCQTTLLWS